MERKECTKILKALADDTRMQIFEMLRGGTLCGCKILESLNITQPTLSHHMKVLADCGLVSSRKEGKWQHYSINCEKFAEYKEYIASISCHKDEMSKCCCLK